MATSLLRTKVAGRESVCSIEVYLPRLLNSKPPFLQDTGVYQHMGADTKYDSDAVAWDSAYSSAPLQPPRPERDAEEEEGGEESMDTTPPGKNTQEVP